MITLPEGRFAERRVGRRPLGGPRVSVTPEGRRGQSGGGTDLPGTFCQPAGALAEDCNGRGATPPGVRRGVW